jgi:hypothetical protein
VEKKQRKTERQFIALIEICPFGPPCVRDNGRNKCSNSYICVKTNESEITNPQL